MAAPSISQDIEIWKPIPGYEHYLVSNFGRVSRLMKPRLGITGYEFYGLSKRRQTKNFSAHSLVAAVFIGPRPKGLDINHIDGDKLNAHVENLEYVSRSENMRHAHRTGLINRAKGERIAKAKLSESQVKIIMSMLDAGTSQKFIAEHFGVTAPTIHQIAIRRTWKHVGNETRLNRGRNRGEQSVRAKLSESQVKAMRDSFELGVSRKQISKSFGVSLGNVSMILTRKTWKHI